MSDTSDSTQSTKAGAKAPITRESIIADRDAAQAAFRQAEATATAARAAMYAAIGTSDEAVNLAVLSYEDASARLEIARSDAAFQDLRHATMQEFGATFVADADRWAAAAAQTIRARFAELVATPDPDGVPDGDTDGDLDDE